ncbi:hypothetical protein GDO86_016222 [Hymenochirus boettgeri]|uniref:Synaptojanin-2-binding protein n=1 Tax=Hymenochirus boettgeri TaxID=247094 RepID=A0A8T2K4L2_9PIPI|nr:hypothetical protein GDO86_016222 [Hymenochirus boettgeri]
MALCKVVNDLQIAKANGYSRGARPHSLLPRGIPWQQKLKVSGKSLLSLSLSLTFGPWYRSEGTRGRYAEVRSPVEEIALARGPSGLGFNIIGGKDQQYIASDSGIYVSSIKENGSAAADGRLQEGDQILEVNGAKLENLLHSAAVDLFRNAGEHVVLKVKHKVQHQQNGPSTNKNETDSEGSSLVMVAIPVVLSIAVLAIFAFVKYRQRM